MKNSANVIFRPTAAQKLLASQQTKVMPRVIRGPAFAALWASLAVLLVGVAAISMIPVPIYAPGQVVFLDPDIQAETGGPTPGFLVILGPEASPLLRPGQQIVLKHDTAAHSLQGSIVKVETGGMTLERAIEKYSLNANPSAFPKAAAIAAARLIAGAPDPEKVYQAQVKVGSRRLIAFFPGMGQLTEK